MIKYFCDICGKEITDLDSASEFKLKKRVHSWHESWWERISVHTSCWENICEKIGKESYNDFSKS